MDFPKQFNVLVTGTPGTGKTTLCAMLQDELQLTHIEVGKIVKDEHFYTEFDAAFDSYIVEEDDEDRLLDYLEPAMVRGGCCVDYHSSQLFPRRWFGCVVVLRADTDKVFDRLSARGYSEEKRGENLECEIQGTCEEEARESYHESCIIVKQSNEISDMLEAVQAVAAMKAQWNQARQEFLTTADIEYGGREGDDDDDCDDNDDNNAGQQRQQQHQQQDQQQNQQPTAEQMQQMQQLMRKGGGGPQQNNDDEFA